MFGMRRLSGVAAVSDELSKMEVMFARTHPFTRAVEIHCVACKGSLEEKGCLKKLTFVESDCVEAVKSSLSILRTQWIIVFFFTRIVLLHMIQCTNKRTIIGVVYEQEIARV